MPFSTLSEFEHAAEAKPRERSPGQAAAKKSTQRQETREKKGEQNAEGRTNGVKLVEEKKLMNEFNNQEKWSMWGCRMCDFFFFFGWLNE